MMPACILLLKIRKFIVPLPWFLLWIILTPFVLLGWFFGHTGLIFFPRCYWLRILSESWRAVPLLMKLHGMEVRVSTAEENVLIKFI